MPCRANLPFVLGPLLAAAAACSDRPKAPPLTNEAVFRDDAIGLRFLVPAGWAVQSRAVVPAGLLPRAIVVVSYGRLVGASPATFELVAAEVPADADLERFLVEHGPGNEKWTASPPTKPVNVNGVDATRFVQTRVYGKDEIRREVTAFRRGDRVYFFVLAFPSADADVRDTVRTTVESITWTK